MNNNDLDTIKQLGTNILGINDVETIKLERLGGLTNKNYKVTADNKEYVFRLPGEGTGELINRREEYICTVAANKIGVDSKLLYFEDCSGVKIAEYIEDAETMDAKLIKDSDNMEAVAGIFKKLHSYDQSVPVIFNVFEKIEEYEVLLKKHPNNLFWDDYKDVKKEVLSLKEEVDNMNIKTTICHNDPLCENFVKGKGRMYLVDWEYAGMNDPMWDLADLFIEAEFTSDDENIFNHFYFGQEPSDQDKRRILINKIFLDFLWSLWGMQRYSCGSDLLDYANERYIRARKHLESLDII